MRIVIHIEAVDPPAGTLRTEREGVEDPGAAAGFTGWLGLLRGLEGVIATARDGAGEGREAVARTRSRG